MGIYKRSDRGLAGNITGLNGCYRGRGRDTMMEGRSAFEAWSDIAVEMVLPETVDDEFRCEIKLAAQHQERAHAAKAADAEIEADEIGLPRQVARIGLVARNA